MGEEVHVGCVSFGLEWCQCLIIAVSDQLFGDFEALSVGNTTMVAGGVEVQCHDGRRCRDGSQG